ncbi:glycosyltransferase family 4 protein [Salinibacterium sp.]|uniref:glycosyltransferase family 4 protein n=1 Tax=Salinibacterium sp. TaxID=1915057 RepID=UPI00286A816F|nr:glycosyltransferase family 4 protein [Salinibacterium sp.]
MTIVSRIYLPEPSAASFALDAIARRLTAAGHEVDVVTTQWPKATGAPIDSMNVYRFPVLRDSRGYVRGYLPYLSFDVPLFFRLLLRRRADVYLVEPPPTTGAVTRIVTAILRRPYIYDAADIWSDAAAMATRSSFVLRLLRKVELFAVAGATGAVTISQGVVDRFRELGSRTPFTVVGFGADTTVFGYAEATGAHDSPYFVYAGSYSEWHGADIFIDAFAIFLPQHPEYRLLFIGNGSERARLTARAAELAPDRVEFRDPVSAAHLAPILHDAVASLASLHPDADYDYAFTSKVYSSLASGCPTVFAGPGPTGPFLIAAGQSHRAGAVADYNPEAVARALESMAENPLTPPQRSSLAAWTAEHHSLDTMADRVVSVVENSRGSAPR